MNSKLMQRFQAAAETIRQRVGEAEIGVILGSGLGDYVDALEDAKYIDYKDIPGFPVSTAPGHAGRWWTGTLHGQRVCMMQGRFHYYEGYDLQDVTMPVRVMALLGVKTLVVTNAAGGVNLNFAQGCLMMLTDFINMSGHNPLTGKNLAEFGTRFPDMTHAYDVQLMEKCRQAAKALGIPLQEGVYMWMNGPTYETPAEIRMARILGADAVGMSTVPETIVARHCGIRELHHQHGGGHHRSAAGRAGGHRDGGARQGNVPRPAGRNHPPHRGGVSHAANCPHQRRQQRHRRGVRPPVRKGWLGGCVPLPDAP